MHKSQIKIALVGSHGTGKTTLLKRIFSTLNKNELDVVQLPEVPRVIGHMASDVEYFRREKNSILKQCLILLAHMVTEAEHTRNHRIIVSDRSIADHWAYTCVLFGHEIEPSLKSIFRHFIVTHLKQYDLIFYLPIEFMVQDDGTREADLDFQSKIDREICEIINTTGRAPYVVRGSVEERLTYCIEVIGKTLGKQI